MTQEEQVIVVGAGPAGIGAGLALGDRGLVLDGAEEIGGLCRTLTVEGAVFDLGGHSFHTPHPEVRELVFDSLEMFVQKREARCYSHGRMIRYPFQTHFRDIGDPEITRECQEGLSAAGGGEAVDFEDYLVQRFGAGIARHFLLPYNRKLWGADLRRLAADWAGERVAAPRGAAEPFAESGGKRRPLQADTTVAYPARGGFGEIMRALARRLPDLRMGRTVTRLDPLRRQVVTDAGEVLSYGRLVSTMPLPKLLALMPDAPAPLVEAAGRLQALPLSLVLVVIDHPVDTPIQRVYCAGPETPAHKIVINHNSSPFLRSLPRHGILAEVSCPSEKPAADGDLEQSVVQGLATLGLIRSAAEVYAVKLLRVPYGYPVPTRDRDAIVRGIKEWLAERGVSTVGRFGEWAYINSDEALHRGLALGKALAEAE